MALLASLGKGLLDRFNLSHALLYLLIGLLAGPLALDLTLRPFMAYFEGRREVEE